MSELEHYGEDFAAIDAEILRAAVTAGVDLNDEAAIATLLASGPDPHEHNDPRAHARERLRGLLVLRNKLKTEQLRDKL